MMKSRDDVRADVLMLLGNLASDWDFSGAITESTYLGGDMGFQSLDIVVLGTAVQDHYQQVLPFTQLFTEIGQREVKDISVGEWIDFIHLNLNGAGLLQAKAVAS
jgi:acyl carrier protein